MKTWVPALAFTLILIWVVSSGDKTLSFIALGVYTVALLAAVSQK